jgi:hypothetical protein
MRKGFNLLKEFQVFVREETEVNIKKSENNKKLIYHDYEKKNGEKLEKKILFWYKKNVQVEVSGYISFPFRIIIVLHTFFPQVECCLDDNNEKKEIRKKKHKKKNVSTLKEE